MKLTFCNGTVLHRNQVRSTFGDWLDGITELSKSLQAIDIDASAYACLSALTLVNGEVFIRGSLWWKYYNDFFQSAMGCWSLRRWRVCRPRSSTRWEITWHTTRTRRRSSITSVASWTSCRCCAPSPSRRFRESSISGLRVLCQSPLSSRSCSPRAFRSEGNFASFNRSCEISRLWCGISAGSGSGEQ